MSPAWRAIQSSVAHPRRSLVVVRSTVDPIRRLQFGRGATRASPTPAFASPGRKASVTGATTAARRNAHRSRDRVNAATVRPPEIPLLDAAAPRRSCKITPYAACARAAAILAIIAPLRLGITPMTASGLFAGRDKPAG